MNWIHIQKKRAYKSQNWISFESHAFEWIAQNAKLYCIEICKKQNNATRYKMNFVHCIRLATGSPVCFLIQILLLFESFYKNFGIWLCLLFTCNFTTHYFISFWFIERDIAWVWPKFGNPILVIYLWSYDLKLRSHIYKMKLPSQKIAWNQLKRCIG